MRQLLGTIQAIPEHIVQIENAREYCVHVTDHSG